MKKSPRTAIRDLSASPANAINSRPSLSAAELSMISGAAKEVCGTYDLEKQICKVDDIDLCGPLR